MAAHSFHVLFHVVFQNFMLVTKILYIDMGISKILEAGLELGYPNSKLSFLSIPSIQ